jgi:hypothetical protein
MLPLALIGGVILVLFALACLSDARSRRRTGERPTIDESNLRFLDYVTRFRVVDQKQTPPDGD